MRSRRPFYVYGEGAITHGDEECEHGLGVHHPMIQREEWPHRRAYLRNRIRRWWAHNELRHFARQIRRGDKPTSRRIDRVMTRLFGPPYPRRPRVWAPLKPEESIYPGAVKEAERWAERRSPAGGLSA